MEALGLYRLYQWSISGYQRNAVFVSRQNKFFEITSSIEGSICKAHHIQGIQIHHGQADQWKGNKVLSVLAGTKKCPEVNPSMWKKKLSGSTLYYSQKRLLMTPHTDLSQTETIHCKTHHGGSTRVSMKAEKGTNTRKFSYIYSYVYFINIYTYINIHIFKTHTRL